jgi:hypothetical protein
MSVLPVPSLTLILGASACPVPLTMGSLILVSSENLERKEVYCSQNRTAVIPLLVPHHEKPVSHLESQTNYLQQPERTVAAS